MRAVRYVAWLAWRRVRRRESGVLIAALGLAVATAVLAGVLAGITIAADRSMSQAVERLPTSAESVRASWFGVPAGPEETHGVLAVAVRRSLATLPLAGPTPLVLFRESTVGGRFVGLAGVDRLAPHVILRSGRLPRSCTAGRCEVLRLRGRGRLPDVPGLRLVQVGTATLRSRRLFGDFLEPTDNATADAEVAPALRESGRYHRPPPAPLVVAEGVAALAASPVLARTYRTYAWVWPLGDGHPRLWQVDDLIGRIERARAALASRSSSFSVAAPEEELRRAERRANVSGRRLLLVGGEAAVLLLAFALLAARGLRRDVGDAHRRLTWYGARRWQLALLTGTESATVALGGVLTGWLVGSVVAAVAAALAGAPPVPVLLHSVASPDGLVLAVAAVLATTGLIALTVSLRGREGRRFGAPELVGSTALVVIGVSLLGGAVDEERLATAEGAAVLLLLLPGLVALVAAIVVARLLPALARLAVDRPRGPLSLRLAALGVAHGSGAAVVTVAFLTIAFGLALLAEGYRATLTRGEREQAAFQAPLDVVAREDLGSLVRVFEAAPLERFRRLAGPGGNAYPVLRVTGSAGRAERVSGVTILGLDRGAVEGLGVWRPDWADGAQRGDLAETIASGADVHLRGATLRAGELALRVGPTLISFAALVETPDGDFDRLELGSADPRKPSTLVGRATPGSRLVSLELVPPPRLIEGGADAGIAFEGVVRVGGALGRQLRTWTGVDGVEVRPAGSGVDLHYVLTRQRTSRVRAVQVTDAAPPKVLVSPVLAELAGGPGARLALQVGGALVTVEVAGVVDRFPTAPGTVVVGDRAALRTAVNAAAPAAARENEVWLDVADERLSEVAEAFARPPLLVLAVTTRADVEEEIRSDPLAQGTLLVLGVAALVALALAAIGLALAVRSDLRDDRGELFELEAQGASPSLLRRIVRIRATALSGVGLLAGAATGVVLVSFVTRVVAVTARGGFAEPPLAATVDLLVVGAGVAAYVLLAALLVGATTRRAFAETRGPLHRAT
ncbi:MAG: hypothetical protein ACRDNY_09090 [Gaiellaceae bacterium]